MGHPHAACPVLGNPCCCLLLFFPHFFPMLPLHSRVMKNLSQIQLQDKHFIHRDGSHWICKICHPNWSPESTAKPLKEEMNGFTWVSQHLKLKHVGQYDKILLMSQTLLVSKEAENTYKWVDWIIT